MSREKQIEEIANILWHIPDNYFLNSYNDCERIAECIYDDGGYRKQSEVAREIIGEILLNHTPDIDGFFTMHESELAELKKKYTKSEKDNGEV